MPGELHVDIEDAVATLTIDNPEKRNALGPPLLAELVAAFDRLEGEREDVRVVVLTGAGERAFCAGFDIEYRQRHFEGSEAPDVEGPEATFGELCARVQAFERPVIAKLNGGTFGGAVWLAAACDLRVAVEDAEFGITPARLGIVYGADAVGTVLAHVGPGDLKELLFTAAFVDADRAREMGLLNHVVPRSELEARTDDLAETIADNAPLAVAGMKEIVDTVAGGELTPAERERAAELERRAERSRDHEEGVRAFLEGREPEFEGR
jgi:methylmalonyl-CoA decarboxylase